MKPFDVKSSTYIEFRNNNKNNDKDSKFEVGNHVKISKYKNILAKGYIPNWCHEVCVTKEIQNTASWMYVIEDLKGEETGGRLYEEEFSKTNQTEFQTDKIIKKKGDKL